MKKNIIILLVFAVTVSFGLPACKKKNNESETSKSSKEKTSESKSSSETSKKQDKTEKQFLSSVENYINKQLDEEGSLPVQTLHGESLTFDGELSLKKIHRSKAVPLDKDKGKYFVCSDFVETTEGGEETTYDFDFIMTKSGDSFDLDRILLHKKNGKELIKWKDGKPVAAGDHKHKGSAAGNRKAKDSDKEHEHPEEDGSEHPEENGSEHPEEDSGSEHPEEDSGHEHPEEDSS